MKLMPFKDLIFEKNVLLLGPASYLYDGSYSQDLKNYDIVVKLNRMVETDLCKDFINDRCDVLYHCINFDSSIGENPIDFGKLISEKVKTVRVAYPPVKSWYANNLKNYSILNSDFGFPTTIIDNNTYMNLCNLCGQTSPNTGTIAIYDLYLQKPKTITIKGITMFSGGYNKNYRTKITTEQEVRELNQKVKNHNIDFQKNFLRTFLNNEKFFIDDHLRSSIDGSS